jgi:hypothetical protein
MPALELLIVATLGITSHVGGGFNWHDNTTRHYINNRDYFVSSSVYHNINTRQKNFLHLPQVFLAMYQKGVYYSDINIFNGLPKAIKNISTKPKKFKTALKHYLLTHSFYSLDEFFLASSNM